MGQSFAHLLPSIFLCSVWQEADPPTACFPGFLASWFPLGDAIRTLEREEGEEAQCFSFSSAFGGLRTAAVMLFQLLAGGCPSSWPYRNITETRVDHLWLLTASSYMGLDGLYGMPYPRSIFFGLDPH